MKNSTQSFVPSRSGLMDVEPVSLDPARAALRIPSLCPHAGALAH